MSSSDEDVLKFIAASFPSVWALELLLVLKREGARNPEELVTALRASDSVVGRALASLEAAGLVAVEDEKAAYLPVSRQVADCVEQVEELYLKRPNFVRRAIISARSSSAAAFADAFKLRKDRDV